MEQEVAQLPPSDIAFPPDTRMNDNSSMLGALARQGHDFCPYAALAKFPYKYIDRAFLQPVSANFFAAGLFRARGWTL